MILWWYYLVAILAAALLVNGAPHFTQGIAGKQFPTPFSGGPGTLDSAARNVLWGSANLIAGGVLLWIIRAGLPVPVLVIELLAVGVAVATTTGHMFAHPERFGRRRSKM